jgi:hypothetical protein
MRESPTTFKLPDKNGESITSGTEKNIHSEFRDFKKAADLGILWMKKICKKCCAIFLSRRQIVSGPGPVC